MRPYFSARFAAISLPAAIGILGAIAGGVAAGTVPHIVTPLFGITILMCVTSWRPQIGIALWLCGTIFVPFWTVITVAGTSIGPSYLVIPVIVAVTLRRLHAMLKGEPFHFSFIDIAILVGVALVLAYQLVFQQAGFLASNVVLALVGAYVLGRLAEVSVQRVFALVMVVVAIWGIAEFLFSWHFFTKWQADLGGMGPELQTRAGLVRSESSFGHAIAYGASVAAALPFARLFKKPIFFQLILAAGVLVSLSRGPILAVVFTFALLAFAARSSKNRLTSALLLVVGLGVAYVLFSFLYNGAGQEDVLSSSQARNRQIVLSLSYTNLIGPADGTQLSSAGRYVTNGVAVVDSTPLRLALDFGWIACGLLLLPVMVASIQVLRRRAGPAAIALTGQVPVLLVTSLITQWQSVIFFIAGLAVSEMLKAQSDRANVRSLESSSVRASLKHQQLLPPPEMRV